MTWETVRKLPKGTRVKYVGTNAYGYDSLVSDKIYIYDGEPNTLGYSTKKFARQFFEQVFCFS